MSLKDLYQKTKLDDNPFTLLAYRFKDQINQNKTLKDNQLSVEITKQSPTIWTACIGEDYGSCNLCYAELNENNYTKKGQRCGEFETIIDQENLTYYKDNWDDPKTLYDVVRYSFLGDDPLIKNYIIQTEYDSFEGYTASYRLPLDSQPSE